MSQNGSENEHEAVRHPATHGRVVRNIIFDLGNVLIHCDLAWASEALAERSSLDAQAIERTLQEHKLFQEFDEGIHSGEAFVNEMRSLIGWRGSGEELEDIWQRMLVGDELMFDYLDELIERGLRTFILSNANPFHVDYVKRTFPRVLSTQGQIFSCECRMVKPNEDIFHHTRDTFGVQPEETIFIDDRLPNIRTAERVGFIGIVHRGYHDTRRLLEEILNS